MLHASRPLSAEQAGHYYDTEYSRGDYYTRGDDTIPGRWFGSAARELGYTGDVRSADFSRLLAGRDRDGRELTQAQTGTGKRRAGWDFTISADKSVSLVALVHGDERLIEAHDAAVQRALVEVEARVQARQRHGKDDSLHEDQTTGRMAAATFRHESSRALDPQLHTHVVIANVTRRDDGQWRALEPREMFRSQKLATAVYRSELARALDRLGYGVEVRRDGSLGIAGFTRADLDLFSQRRAQVLEYVRKLGKTTGDFGQEAAQQSRASKQREIDRESLVRAWRERAREHGVDIAARVRVDRANGTQRGRRDAEAAVEYAIEHLSERNAAFRVDDLERVALERGLGAGASLGDVRAVVAERDDLRRSGRVVTTDRAIALEREVIRHMRDGRGRGAAIAGELPTHLTAEQAHAARHVLDSRDLVIGIEGKAGTGKSHTLTAVHDAAEWAGWTVRAFAPTTSAVEVLRADGLDTTTVARFIREKTAPTQGPQLWIVDEAGLLSTEAAVAILRKAQVAGAKVVLVGDRMQHRAVEAGQPFAQLVDAGMPTARLQQIQRQRDAALRAAVAQAARGDAARAVALLDRQGRVVEQADRSERLNATVERYLKADGSALVVTATNADRIALNNRIREARIAAGQVEKASLKAPILVAKDLTRAERGTVESYAPGDRVTFRSNSRVYGVRAGQSGRVTMVDAQRREVCVALDGAAGLVVYNPARLRGTTVARVEERRFAVGDRIEFREADKARGVVNGSLGTLRALDRETGLAQVELDKARRTVTVDLRQPQALDHGYVSTSYRSQGRTVDHVIAMVDAQHASRELIYVAASRGRREAVLITDDRAALLTRLGRRETAPTQALDVERERAAELARQAEQARLVEHARLVAAAQAELPTIARRHDQARQRTDWDGLERVRDERYEVEQRARPDIDQVRHHDLLSQRESAWRQLHLGDTASERLDARDVLATLDGQLYELRHGPRSDLGGFAGRLPMRLEERLHRAHAAIDARAESKGWPETRSPLTARALARLDGDELRRVVEAAVELSDASWRREPSERALRSTCERGARELTELVDGRRPEMPGPALEWTR